MGKEALGERETLREQHARFQATAPRTLSPAERDAIRSLATDLPALWHAPSTTAADRKHLLRLLIERIDVTVIGESEQADATVTWAGGHHTTTALTRPVAKYEQLSYYPRLLERTAELADQGHAARQIARYLNDDGYRPPKRAERFAEGSVQDLLRRLNRLAPQGRNTRAPHEHLLGTDDWWISDLCANLGIPSSTMHSWIARGLGRRPQTPGSAAGMLQAIHADPTEQQRLRELHARPNGYYSRRRYLDHQTPPTADTERSSDEPRHHT